MSLGDEKRNPLVLPDSERPEEPGHKNEKKRAMYYYVHTQKDAQGDYEVHTENCSHLPLPQNRELLGAYPDCHSAVIRASMRGYSPVNGCYWCCRACHTS